MPFWLRLERHNSDNLDRRSFKLFPSQVSGFSLDFNGFPLDQPLIGLFFFLLVPLIYIGKTGSLDNSNGSTECGLSGFLKYDLSVGYVSFS